MPKPGGLWIAGQTRVKKVTVAHTALQIAATTNNITFYTTAPRELIKSVTMKHSASFVGGLISAYTLSLGIAGNLTKFLAAQDVFQAVGDTTIFGALMAAADVESYANAVALKLAAVATGANLSVSTGGSVDIWVESVLLP